jgi:hypothetical protein
MLETEVKVLDIQLYERMDEMSTLSGCGAAAQGEQESVSSRVEKTG